MNRIVMPALLLVMAAALPGCGSTSRAVSDETDQAKIDRVERAAQTTGAQVRWINPPRKPSVAPGS